MDNGIIRNETIFNKIIRRLNEEYFLMPPREKGHYADNGIYLEDAVKVVEDAAKEYEKSDFVQEIRNKAIDDMVNGIREILEDNAIYNIDCITSLAYRLKGQTPEHPAKVFYNRIIERLTELQVNKSLDAASQRSNGGLQNIRRIQYHTYANAVMMTQELANECNVTICGTSEFYKKLIEHFTAWASKEAPANDDYDETRETICDTIYDAIAEIDEIAKELNIPEYEEQEERE